VRASFGAEERKAGPRPATVDRFGTQMLRVLAQRESLVVAERRVVLRAHFDFY
jgi:hypothetical protein